MAQYTSENLKFLAAEMREAKQTHSPFALLTGAGCSFSAGIPLAPALVTKIAESYPHCVENLPAASRGNYGDVMASITPQQREKMLKPILEKAQINWAHVAIACMMKVGFIGRALTFNFDPLLAKACGMCGHYPAIYDFGVSPAQTFDHIQP